MLCVIRHGGLAILTWEGWQNKDAFCNILMAWFNQMMGDNGFLWSV